MFYLARAFDQDITGWSTPALTVGAVQDDPGVTPG